MHALTPSNKAPCTQNSLLLCMHATAIWPATFQGGKKDAAHLIITIITPEKYMLS
jgi:hypothetical protein